MNNDVNILAQYNNNAISNNLELIAQAKEFAR